MVIYGNILNMEKIRKYMIPVLVAIIAIGSGVSYLQKGDVVIERGTNNAESDMISEVPESVSSDESDNVSGKVNLNTASLDELQIAPGIGPAKAAAIIEYRNTYGDFKSVDELTEISGIGDKTLQKIRDYYTVN